ncbi:hypothetical protein BST22_12585 [Mycolicibacterium chubuense]|uniref:Glycosyltransferase subfamily 4-like N-terminal domain-containing protein n=1 Tax=Mycolicibacterium chubuense TaxID=1800 RepID=A0A0J6W9J9_MYCCU|nr:glycosyltransferase [Mycolicibacterium chubuense]KMO79264.1 hypothetical protein MCHUDSM44219_02806 [Mycolicibacterium chubuense]ORA52416.1 hypothetical protein BST22_12585 [Mycolicibacterium chubuense]SPX99552.1 Uncharacterised protein [Mycolicibacterium chubuense]
MIVTQALVGPRHHGVVRFGLALHDTLQSCGLPLRQVWQPGTAELSRALDGGALHVQFTDRLFGDSPQAAAGVLAALARRSESRLTVTLHDLPQPSDGQNFARRAAAYADVVARCAGVAVSSAHERELLRDLGVDVGPVAVIPLPIGRRAPAHVRPAEPRVIGVFGFLYPGKGHEEVIAATADLPPEVEVHAIGETSSGHQDLVAELTAQAHLLGRRFHVTGHIPDDLLTEALQRVAVPVVAHTHVSASGSLGSWLSASRRPLAPTNRYTREVEERNPGMLTLYPDTGRGLRTALARALESPESTWLPEDSVPRPTDADAAFAYHHFFQRWHR